MRNYEFKEFISLQFQDGMSWENYNIETWHIDHVRPCMSFDMEDEAQQYVCFNWRNMRPLSAFDNISKKDSYSKDEELAWAERMRDLGFEGELYLRY